MVVADQITQQASVGEPDARSADQATAEIEAFRLIAGDGTDLGTFQLPGPNRSYRFEVDITTDRLRLKVISSSGGNTGLVELGAWTDAS